MTIRLTTAERKRQIIDEAIKIIHKKGYSALSIRNLAKSVGISEPAIYRHFASKEDIILGILDRILEFGNILKDNLKKVKGTKEKIRRLIFLQIEFLERYPQMTSIIFSDDIFQPDKRINDKLQAIFDNRHSLLNMIINQAREEGEVIDIETEDLGNVIFGYLHLIVFKWRRSNFKFSLMEKSEKLIELIYKIIFI
ncbi:MAG: hypothetical protein DRP84_02160 [Spirochaetes bacterium]|nr:MAG: hypothetical protein DRP84_02160 [Spirochaetota bacterium]